MALINIKVKPTSGGNTFDVSFTKQGTIREFKEEVSKHCDISAEQIRLIYKGMPQKHSSQILEDGMCS